MVVKTRFNHLTVVQPRFYDWLSIHFWFRELAFDRPKKLALWLVDSLNATFSLAKSTMLYEIVSDLHKNWPKKYFFIKEQLEINRYVVKTY